MNLVIGAFVIAAMAGCGAPHRAGGGANSLPIGQRSYVQKRNINQGVRQGDLSRREAQQLRARQGQINQARWQSKVDDGYIDRRERRAIKKKQRRLGNQIQRQRNDNDGR